MNDSVRVQFVLICIAYTYEFSSSSIFMNRWSYLPLLYGIYICTHRQLSVHLFRVIVYVLLTTKLVTLCNLITITDRIKYLFVI